jgi:3-hydroxy-9,10-secoandrosta-1,3,5(10)-triene-9,17-dione monooxygenase reductase component
VSSCLLATFTAVIHDDNPFVDAEEDRDPIRRFRGRLAAPVTVITSGPPAARTGLTISSLVVVEGDEPLVFFLLGELTDLWDRMLDTGTFVVHVLEQRHRELSDRFAGYRPSPGGLFHGISVVDTAHGPVIEGIDTRAACRFMGSRAAGPLVLVEGRIEDVMIHDLTEPLQYFRGRYIGGDRE